MHNVNDINNGLQSNFSKRKHSLFVEVVVVMMMVVVLEVFMGNCNCFWRCVASSGTDG